ncbi:MAG: 5'-methylthioadenosine/S-adenosylhomocysteine nucleosidase [Acidibacillus sp.]|uniref:5'-methylthioadenosine/S-adenosylhomocysteine nucleosidase n=1 Tax=Sulfoacidibacillus ferrooxidans TaxID=2005001 RepID=A0A9X1V8V1_9BACL|nr:5'-methylthioadenosine/S-adenosylhomocysteine nucleosidase [Sulfoacidibacillus ferrooxidans]MCI0183049.1 5'-methylthioadenosine/S-adenosylhomocysteine nucleosidase [Sulfoacidibacillus ferrooxidans]MCY0893547.1 5'-methylthioadenosine/S-adenosylhomocysteine nucleosidase [Acidibacillus sp.]
MKTAIIGAMEQEIILLQETLAERETVTIHGIVFSTGFIGKQEIVLLKSGIGKVNAAIGTTLLKQLFNPDNVINTGSAGGFDPSLHVGDIVISSEVRYHDVDATIFGYEYGQVPKMPSIFMPDSELVQLAYRAARQVMGAHVMKGPIASGDSFMNDPKRVAFVREKFPNLCAAEMESGAIAQVCYQLQMPFVVIRSLSDIAGQASRITYEKYIEVASENSANVVIKLVKEMGNVILR